MPGPRIFLSYRRDDAAGYAGRLEEALERRLGAGTVFRDVADTAPGQDFTRVIDDGLATADAIVVLIGPRWAGPLPDGRRRLDDAGDFVRLEAEAALRHGARLVPVLLPGATMPDAASLPPPLQPLARRQALAFTEAHWAADVDRLVAALGLAVDGRSDARPGAAAGAPANAAGARRRTTLLWGALAGVAAVGGVAIWAWPGQGGGSSPLPGQAVPARAANPDTSTGSPQAAAVQGTWQAEVRYPWGVRVQERFSFSWRDGQWSGQASYLGVQRPIEQAQWHDGVLRFETRSQAVAGDERRELVHHYAVRAAADRRALAIDWQASGGFGPMGTLRIEALPDGASPAPAASRP